MAQPGEKQGGTGTVLPGRTHADAGVDAGFGAVTSRWQLVPLADLGDSGPGEAGWGCRGAAAEVRECCGQSRDTAGLGALGGLGGTGRNGGAWGGLGGGVGVRGEGWGGRGAAGGATGEG